MQASRFCASIWRHAAFWNRDIDKGCYPDVLEVLIDQTATPLVRALNTTFWGYRGFPAWDLYGSGVSPWLLSIGLRGGRRHRPWLQYCPYCLRNDPDPLGRRVQLHPTRSGCNKLYGGHDTVAFLAVESHF
jgi:hypothetical protein